MIKFAKLVYRDLRSTFVGGSDAGAAILFYVLALIMFPLGFGTDGQLLGKIASGAIWMAALFSSMLSLDRIIRSDYEDGTLEQMVLSGITMEFIIVSKCFSHWLSNGFPIVLLSPILSIIIGLDTQYIWIMSLALFLGTPSLTLIGIVPTALSCTLGKGGVIITMVILPLMLPILILGSTAINAEILGLGGLGYLYALAAIFPVALLIVPFLASKAIKLSWE